MSDNHKIILGDISIRHDLKPGDIGYVLHMHGDIYYRENNYGLEFEQYVATSLLEFYDRFDPLKDRVWICEHSDEIIGTLFLVNRGDIAQLRYFLLKSAFRGIGLGRKLMDEFMTCLHMCGYRSCYLWTTNEQVAATSLYKEYGFVLTEQKFSTAFGKSLTEQRYELVLKD